MYRRGFYSYGWRRTFIISLFWTFVAIGIAIVVLQAFDILPKWTDGNWPLWYKLLLVLLIPVTTIAVGVAVNWFHDEFKDWRDRPLLDNMPDFFKNHHFAFLVAIALRNTLYSCSDGGRSHSRTKLVNPSDRAKVNALADKVVERYMHVLTSELAGRDPQTIPALFSDAPFTCCYLDRSFPKTVTELHWQDFIDTLNAGPMRLVGPNASTVLMNYIKSVLPEALDSIKKYAATHNDPGDEAINLAINRETEKRRSTESSDIKGSLGRVADSQEEVRDELKQLRVELKELRRPPESIGVPSPKPTERQEAIFKAAEPFADAIDKFEIAVGRKEEAPGGEWEAAALALMNLKHDEERKKQSEDRYRFAMAAGRSRYDRGWYADAQPYFAQAMSEKPMDEDARWYEAACVQMPNPPEDLIRRADQVFKQEMSRGSATGIGNYALFLTKFRQKHDEAEANYRRAIAANPKDAQNLSNFAHFLNTVRKNDAEAEEYYLQAIEVDPMHAEALNNYAILLSDVRKDYRNAELMYKKAIEADPVYANALAAYGRYLLNVHGRHDEAERLYRAAMNSNPKHPAVLGTYASFLESVRGKEGEAKAHYERAIEADPKNAINLGNYAVFLEKFRTDEKATQAMYERAIEADPKSARNLGNYATFLEKFRTDDKATQAMYERAIEAGPKHANNLGNYATFLKNIRKKHDEAEAMYLRAIEADPKNAINLGNYALFLTDIRKKPDEAEAMYLRAIEADPTNAINLGNYALFLTDIRKKHDEAEAMYLRAIEADPKHANNLGNYAELLLLQARVAEARTTLGTLRALINPAEPTGTLLASWVLGYMLLEEADRDEGLGQIRRIITQSDARAATWSFDLVIEQAKKLNHPEAAWLDKLAEVVAGRAGPETLADWPAWQKV